MSVDELAKRRALRIRQIDTRHTLHDEVEPIVAAAFYDDDDIIVVALARAAAAQRRSELVTRRIDEASANKVVELVAKLCVLHPLPDARRFVEQRRKVGSSSRRRCAALAQRVLDVVSPPNDVDDADRRSGHNASSDAQAPHSLQHHVDIPQHAKHHDAARDDDIHSASQNLHTSIERLGFQDFEIYGRQ